MNTSFSRNPSGREGSHARPVTVGEQSQMPSRNVQVSAAGPPTASSLEDEERLGSRSQDTSAPRVPTQSVIATDLNSNDWQRDEYSDCNNLGRNGNNYGYPKSGGLSESQPTSSTAAAVSVPSGGNLAINLPRRSSDGVSHQPAMNITSSSKARSELSFDFDPLLREPRGRVTYTGNDSKGVNGSDLRNNSSPSTPRLSVPHQEKPETPVELAPGQKRTAAGDIKSSPSTASPALAPLRQSMKDVAGRLRSRTVDSVSHGTRIAELSVQLRARLSYAAAQVEKDRRTHRLHSGVPLRLMQSFSSTPPTAEGGLTDMVSSPRMERVGSPRRYGDSNGSFEEGTTVSEPGSPTSSYIQHPYNDPTRMSQWHIPSSSHANLESTLRESRSSPTDLQRISKITTLPEVSFSGQTRQRNRPNPNELIPRSSEHNQSPLHRRYYSQESGVSVTPSTVPSSYPPRGAETSHDNNLLGQGTHSQNATMEQDAIETLLFMSSPENSGHHPVSQDRQNIIPTSIDASMESTGSSATGSQTQRSSLTEYSQSGHAATSAQSGKCGGGPNPEAQGGDEIDRMLDQMGDSESEDERRTTLYASGGLSAGASSGPTQETRDGVAWKKRGV